LHIYEKCHIIKKLNTFIEYIFYINKYQKTMQAPDVLPPRPFIAGSPLPYPLVPPAPVQERQQGPRGSYKISPEAPDFDCPVCFNAINIPENKIMTSCNHAFCGACISHLQSLAQDNACIKCPMCRLYLKRPESQIVPFEKISLAKIRRELIQQNQLVESLQFQIQNAPDRIASYMRTIENIMRAANHAHRQLDRQLRRQSVLQEQVTRRARPRRVVVQVTEEIILV
jgi:hypothetical protein